MPHASTPRRTTDPALRVLSWGAGLDSTTIALMSEHGDLPRLDAIIFADTQQEPQHVYTTIEWASAALTIPIHRVSAGDLGVEGRRHPPYYVEGRTGRGTPSRRQCTKHFKILPIIQQIRLILGIQPGKRVPSGIWVEQWIGIGIDEMQRAACSDIPWITHRFPLIEQRMRKHDCRQWLLTHGYPIPGKSSCIFCPYHSNAAWRHLRDHSPEEWAMVVNFDEQIRSHPPHGYGKRLPYLHRSLLPLAMAPIDTPDTGQTAFCFSCNT